MCTTLWRTKYLIFYTTYEYKNTNIAYDETVRNEPLTRWVLLWRAVCFFFNAFSDVDVFLSTFVNLLFWRRPPPVLLLLTLVLPGLHLWLFLVYLVSTIQHCNADGNDTESILMFFQSLSVSTVCEMHDGANTALKKIIN